MLDFHYHRIIGQAPEVIREGFNVAISLYNNFGLTAPEMKMLGHNTALRAMLMAEFEHYRKQVYSIGPAMATMFAKTRLDDLSENDFRSPYPAMYIKIPDGLNPDWVIHGGDSVGWLPVEGMYVIFWKEMDENMELRVGENPSSFIRKPHTEEGFVAQPLSMTILLTSKGPTSNKYDDADFRFNVPLAGDPNEFLENFLNTATWTKDLEGQQLPDSKMLTEMVRIIVNLCTYLDSDGRETEWVETADEEAIERHLDRVQRTKPTKSHYKKYVTKLRKAEAQCDVYTVNPRLEEDLERKASERGLRIEEFLRVEHTVGGHRQRYWMGKKKTDERRRVWKWKIGYVRCEGNTPDDDEPARIHYEVK